MTEKEKGKGQEEQQQMFPPGPTVASLQDSDILASMSAFARAFNTDRETLRRCLLENDVEPAGERGGHKLYALRHVYRAWTDATEDTDPDKLTPFKRRAWYQGEREKLHLQVERGELLEALEAERMFGQLNQMFVRAFETATDVLERDVGLTAAHAARLEAHFDGIREELHRTIVEQAESEANDDVQTSAQTTTPSSGKPASTAPAGGSAIDDAIAFLRETLAAGPRPSAELIAGGKEVGLSEATLRRAKASLGATIEARRQGRGWVWQLAQDAQSS